MTRTALIAAAILAVAGPAAAQTRTVRETATAYGARLNAKGQPQDLNQARINNRINTRIDTRLSLRIERFRVGSETNPTAAFQAPQDDRTRRAPVVAPPPADADQP